MSRYKAVVSVVALLFAGIAIGALGMHLAYAYHLHHPPPPPDPAAFAREIGSRLDLTADQQGKIGEILDEARRKGAELRQAIRPQLERQIDETHKRILALLTDEQRGKFLGLLREHRAHADRFFLGAGLAIPGLGHHPPGPWTPRSEREGEPPDGPAPPLEPPPDRP